MARLPSSTLNSFAGAYLALRIVYTYLYVNGTTSQSTSSGFLGLILSRFHMIQYTTMSPSFSASVADNYTETLANARAGTWLAASITCLTLFVKAGNKFREGLKL